MYIYIYIYACVSRPADGSVILTTSSATRPHADGTTPQRGIIPSCPMLPLHMDLSLYIYILYIYILYVYIYIYIYVHTHTHMYID